MTTEVTRPEKYPAGRHPKSLANLRPYKPGENGHQVSYPLKERLRHALDHPLKEPKPDAPAGDHLVYATLKAALEVVPVAFREAWDRVEGKLTDQAPVRDINVVFIIGKGYQETAGRTLIEGGPDAL